MSDADTDWLADLEETKPVIPEDDKLKMLSYLADHYTSLEEEIEVEEEKLRVLHERFRVLKEDIIPDKMMEFGIKKIVLDDGSILGYGSFYAGKVINEKAYDWLEQNGYADAVKQELKLETSRVDNEILDEVKEFIGKMNVFNLSIREKQSIHHMTLGSAIKSLTKQGKELPQSLFETYIGNRASIKRGKSDG